jgi:hypothetical protein
LTPDRKGRTNPFVRWVWFAVAGVALLAASVTLVWQPMRSEPRLRLVRHVAAEEPGAGREGAMTAMPAAQATPRPVTVRAAWKAASGSEAEHYSEGRFAPAALRFGERFYIERVCVSDARKLTMISYRDTVGHTDVPLPLGERGIGRVDPSERNCTLFDGVEATRVEKCKCWFQCAAEAHHCTVSGVARRP